MSAIVISCSSDDDVVTETTITAKDFETTIDENPTEGQELGTIEATTNQGTLTYTLKSEEPEGALSIDSKTGKITVKDAILFDYETRKKLTATLLIKNGDSNKEAKVTVHLNDIHDPLITLKDFETTIDENPTEGQELGTIEATTNQGTLTYTLKNEEPKGALNIDKETGKITVKDATLFDYETKKKLTATVLVNDNEANITIHLNDIIETGYISFKDPNFKKALLEHTAPVVDINSDGEISIEEAQVVERLAIDDKNISDLSGIEYFTALEFLGCRNNKLTTLNVSKNTALKTLWCGDNQLTTLHVSKNTALRFLSCRNNKLTTLDLSKNTALKILWCDNNQLTTLNVSKNTTLEDLYCRYNKLTLLDVSKNTALTSFGCSNNNLTSLDVSKNTALTSFGCAKNNLTTLDLSKNTALTHLNCTNNNLITLDVSKNTALTNFSCSNNNLTSLDVSKSIALEFLKCHENNLTTLDLSKNIKLDLLYCHNNQLTTLDVSKNTALTHLWCFNNKLTDLTMNNGKNASMASVDLRNNPDLSCIQVDDPEAAYLPIWKKDDAARYSRDCTF
ncbi:leucine-rich repeat domain-containing protein [Aquimarina spinulae]|uniref:leucine-rich repeat domain-containing protein n=1 Tax=Aquimarina spinulae TaxID=1192023 RepID=UPI00131F3F36|nr:leucine-rich repeat domain-containing protein [Aquimarina spinulae]